MFGLRFRPLIAPDQRGANDLIVPVQQHGSVHLSRKADAHNLVRRCARGLNCFSDRNCRCPPPIRRVLLRPTGLWTRERRVLCCSGSNNAPHFIQNQRARSTGSHVNAKGSDKASRLLLDLLPVGTRLSHWLLVTPPRYLPGLPLQSFLPRPVR